MASLVTKMVKNPPAVWETWVWSLGWEDPLEEGRAAHSIILAWRIPWTEEPGGLQSMVSQSVGQDLKQLSTHSMDGPWGHYAKWSQAEKNKYCMISLICRIEKVKLRNSRLGITRGWRMGEMGRYWSKSTNSSYKMNKFWISNHSMHSSNS